MRRRHDSHLPNTGEYEFDPEATGPSNWALGDIKVSLDTNDGGGEEDLTDVSAQLRLRLSLPNSRIKVKVANNPNTEARVVVTERPGRPGSCETWQ
jgi:hypothetical protein